MMNLDQLEIEALQLGPRDRAMLAARIWESLEDPYGADHEMSDEDAVQLAIRRDEEIEDGSVNPVAHGEMMARLRNSES
ncbi:MAG: hypothetical protein N838_22660 [Thiohalocapsa sp. PB-PSB1]|jgi:putative addiction module component (TIGR02574 family)|nr:MAG: hypothetical protein N838_22660 [Thiohalocapsa sp. PB-PSB1]